MPIDSYSPPISQLLALGDDDDLAEDWSGYLNLGLTSEHVPDLIRLALDEPLRWYEEDPDSDEYGPEIFGPVHAWRALAQLHATEAAEPLTRLLHNIDKFDDDWVGEELPDVFEQLGPATVPVLARYLEQEDGEAYPYACVSAGEALSQIGRRYPEARAECVATMTRRLEPFAENDESLNGFLIHGLIELKAVEAAPLIEQAFAAEAVDYTVDGDWEDAQIALGLKEKRETPRRNYIAEAMGLTDFLPRLEAPRPIPEHIHKWNVAVQAKAQVKAEAKEHASANKKTRKRKRK